MAYYVSLYYFGAYVLYLLFLNSSSTTYFEFTISTIAMAEIHSFLRGSSMFAVTAMQYYQTFYVILYCVDDYLVTICTIRM